MYKKWLLGWGFEFYFGMVVLAVVAAKHQKGELVPVLAEVGAIPKQSMQS